MLLFYLKSLHDIQESDWTIVLPGFIIHKVNFGAFSLSLVSCAVQVACGLTDSSKRKRIPLCLGQLLLPWVCASSILLLGSIHYITDYSCSIQTFLMRMFLLLSCTFSGPQSALLP